MQLKPEQYRKLHAALVAHFSASDWRYILRAYFDLARDAVVSAELNTHELVTELIDYLEDRNLLPKLLQVAVEERPNVAVLQDLQRELAPMPVVKHDPQLIEDRFNKMVADLGSPNLAVQISAAVMLLVFLKPEYASYHDRVYYILRAHLRDDHHAGVRELLVDAFERAIRLGLPYTETKSSLDMSRTNLPRIDLGGLDLSGADIAFANLHGSNLEETKLFRARGYGVDLSQANLTKANLGEARLQEGKFPRSSLNGANLVSADLKRADLRGVTCKQAKLQSAHLEDAKLIGAQFEQADLNDTYFQRAVFDDKALRSIVKAYNWQNAHFDAPIMKKLQRMANQKSDAVPTHASPTYPTTSSGRLSVL